jgi:hypothetical protein
MILSEIWLIVLALSAPISGVVGFAIQLRNVRKLRLENEKLFLEIEHLKTKKEQGERQIVRASYPEIMRYGYDNDIRFSRRADKTSPRYSGGGSCGLGLIVIAIIIFLVYLVYDIYRLVGWLIDYF